MRKSWKNFGKRIISLALAAALCITTDAGSLLCGTKSRAEAAGTAMTDADVENLYETYFYDKTYDRVTCHDPSVVVGYYEGEYTSNSTVYGTQNAGNTRNKIYFIFGSHMAWAYSLDLKNWKTFTNNINTNYRTMFAGQGEWSAEGDSVYDISGNLWAPDVIWDASYDNGNGAWLMYMSVNGCSWNSSISLLKADSLNGSWTYVDTIVYSGFTDGTTYNYEKTDYKEVTGDTSLPDRYKRTAYTCKDGNTTCTATTWNRGYGAHAIDPCVIEDGDKLWMTYGSWSGGIYMLELDKSTGLRKSDFKPAYEDGVSDPYMGYIIAGGSGVSGEASYIEKIGDKYYLFVSYGGFASDGGYNMRIFSADTITGPYTDMAGKDARRAKTSGAGTTDGTVGNRLMAYYKWSFMENGFTAQGHNSAVVDDDGKAYVVYHTRTDDGSEGHSVRVHQLFQAKNGGLVTAPFEYCGESLSASSYATSDVTGEYKVLTMVSSAADHANRNCVTEQSIQLNADGSVTGAYTGTWEQTADGPYVTMVSGGVTYQGVFVKQNVEETACETMCLTLVGDNNISIWGYQPLAGNLAIARAVKNMRVSIGEMTYENLDLPTDIADDVTVTWSSSDSDIIASDGTVTAPSSNTDVTLTITLESGGYTYSKDYTTTVLASLEDADIETDLKALYNFNEDAKNTLDSTQEAEMLAQASGTAPFRKYNAGRGSKVLSQQFGYADAASISYAKYPNPLQGETLTGATVSLWMNCVGTVDCYDAVWSFFDEDASDSVDGRIYLTPNMYLGYNGTGGWFDLNHGDHVTNAVTADTWNLVTVTITESTVGIYINGTLTYTYDNYVAFGEIEGGCDKSMPLKVISSAANFYTGYGSWWGSAPLYMDNIRIYGRALSDTDILKLYSEELKEAAADIASNVVDTSGYYYYNDYNATDTSAWVSQNAPDSITMQDDTADDYRSYIQFAPGTANDRSAYSAFEGVGTLPDCYTAEFDVKLTAGTGNETQLALSTAAYSKANSKLTENYIWDMKAPANSTTWTVNGGNTVTIPKGSWVHVSTEVSQTEGEAVLTITGDNVSFTETITGLTATQVQGIFLLSGRYNAVSCFDNVKIYAYQVAFDANGGEGSMENQAFKQGTAAKLKKNTFIKDGFRFAGWSTTASGESAYGDEKSVTDLSTSGGVVTLYAVWEDMTATPEPTEDVVEDTPAPTPTVSPEVSESPEASVSPEVTESPEVSVSPSSTPSTTKRPVVTPIWTPDPTSTPEPTVEPTAEPIQTPVVTVEPTAEPVVTETPTTEPTTIPTVTPVETPVPEKQIITSEDTNASLEITVVKDSENDVEFVIGVIYTGDMDSKEEGKAEVVVPDSYMEAAKEAGITEIDICISNQTVADAKELSDTATSIKITVPFEEQISVGNICFDAEAVQNIQSTGQKVLLEITSGEEDNYTITIPKTQLAKLTDLTQLNVETKEVNELEGSQKNSIKNILSNNDQKEKDAYILSMSEVSGNIGMKVKSKVEFSATQGDNVYVYRYDEKTGKLVEIANSKKSVGEDESLQIQLYSGSDYVVTKSKLSGNKVVPILENVKVESVKKKQSKGSTQKIKLDLGDSLVNKTSFKAKTGFGKQVVKITYSSNKNKVASVSASGKVKAKKKGKVTITVKAKLADGRTKKIKVKITVK